MTDNKELLELYKQHQTGQGKYTYFLLAAAIGFAVQKADGPTLSWWLLPVAAAILCWGISFFFGCKNLIWVQIATYANFSLLQLSSGVHPTQPPHPELTKEAILGVRAALNQNVNTAQFYSIWQFRTLIAGAVFFIGWRVAEMIRLTYAA